jgi:alcohol dehydrogenase (cytochrome c)
MHRFIRWSCTLLAAGLLVPPAAPQSAGTWTNYHGSLTGNRFSSLSTINTSNVAALKLIYKFAIPSPSTLEVTPVVSGNLMYITGVNSVYTFNLSTGQPGWSFVRPQTPGVVQDAGSGYNRGAALGPNGVYLTTDNAHLLSLNPTTGGLQWETVMADYTQNYGDTAAPLYLPGPNLVIAGVSGGDSGIRGFVAAYDADTGNQVWQFYTTPSGPSDPLAATWGSGAVLPHGCGATWMTGTYDSSNNAVYWGVGNPCPNFDGDNRQGDDLYTGSVVSLNASTGALNWYFQYTPHDLWDFDGATTPMLVDTTWQGTPRHLLMTASRNGYLYVLDRNTGQFLSGFPFVKNLTWATGLDASGRPIQNPSAVPTTTGATVCPSNMGGNNYQSIAYGLQSGLFYVQALESCAVFLKESEPANWLAGQEYGGGIVSSAVATLPQKHLRAIDPASGTIVWDVPQPGYAASYGGVLATAGGLVFYGDDNGAFSAVDASSGAPLWTFEYPGYQGMKSSPMTFLLNGKQYVAIAFRSVVAVFGLPVQAPALVQGCPADAGKLGVTYSSAITTQGGTPPFTYSVTSGSLPAGLTLNAGTGAITGTPGHGGQYGFDTKVADSMGHSAQASCNITVTPLPLRFICAEVPSEVAVPYLSAVSISGGVPPYTFQISSGTLPAGLTLNTANGVISGTPMTTGQSNYSATVTDSSGIGAGSATANCFIKVTRKIRVGCPVSSGQVGVAYNSALSAAGGLPPNLFLISTGMLPPGLSLNSSTGAITGTPTSAGSFPFAGMVEDSTGLSGGISTAKCTIQIAP